ncbi:hypothetical protein HanPI659440_Chr01g0016411 [Helianthus annuus]|nr:hypothetical protein HanPI659440_Chr01g0016411 [Helianthus annuus]
MPGTIPTPKWQRQPGVEQPALNPNCRPNPRPTLHTPRSNNTDQVEAFCSLTTIVISNLNNNI